jgi:hypothetical protein
LLPRKVGVKNATVGMSFTAIYNNKNQITNRSTVYDVSGKLTRVKTGVLQTYSWDAENRVLVLH